MAPGARSKSAAPMFGPELFRKQMYCIEESTCDILGTFWRPRSDSAPGNCSTLAPPRYAPDCNAHCNGFKHRYAFTCLILFSST